MPALVECGREDLGALCVGSRFQRELGPEEYRHRHLGNERVGEKDWRCKRRVDHEHHCVRRTGAPYWRQAVMQVTRNILLLSDK